MPKRDNQKTPRVEGENTLRILITVFIVTALIFLGFYLEREDLQATRSCAETVAPKPGAES